MNLVYVGFYCTVIALGLWNRLHILGFSYWYYALLALCFSDNVLVLWLGQIEYSNRRGLMEMVCQLVVYVVVRNTLPLHKWLQTISSHVTKAYHCTNDYRQSAVMLPKPILKSFHFMQKISKNRQHTHANLASLQCPSARV